MISPGVSDYASLSVECGAARKRTGSLPFMNFFTFTATSVTAHVCDDIALHDSRRQRAVRGIWRGNLGADVSPRAGDK